MAFKYNLGDALRNHSPGAVATALEKYGCSGYDRFGRMDHFTGDKLEPVLSIVADFYKAEMDWINDDRNYDEVDGTYNGFDANDAVEVINHSAYWSYGWESESDIPIFTDSDPIKSDHSDYILGQGKPDHPRQVNTTYIVIAALLDYSAIKLEDIKNADFLEDLTREIGVPVSNQTIGKILAGIPPLLEKRRKSSKKT